MRAGWVSALLLFLPVTAASGFAQERDATPEASPVVSVTPAATPLPSLRSHVGGVVTAAAVFGGDQTPVFAIPRAAVWGSVAVADRLSLAAEATWLGGGDQALDGGLGVPDQGNFFLQYAAADLAVVREALIFRAGLLAVPVGWQNLHSDEGQHDLLIRPVEEIYLIPTPWFDAGGGAAGGFQAGIPFEYQAYVLSGISNAIDTQTGLQNARQPPASTTSANRAVAARLLGKPAAGIEFGLSGYTAAYDPAGRERLGLGEADAVAELGDFRIAAEGVYALTQGGTGAAGAPVPRALWGGNADLRWLFMPSFLRERMPPEFSAARFAASVRYSFVNLDGGSQQPAAPADSPDDYPARERLDAGLSFRPLPEYVVRAEYEARWQSGARRLDDDRAVLSVSAGF